MYTRKGLNTFRTPIVGACVLAALVFIGCKSAGTAIRLEQRKTVGITSVTIGEYTVPAFTVSEGPSLSTYQTKDVPSEITIEGSATTTNRTTALGIYDSEESKTMVFKGTFKLYTTNETAEAKADVK